MDNPITDFHSQQYQEEGFFILESVIPEAHLRLLRENAGLAVRRMDEQMDREGSDTLGINHRGKRYFVGQTYANHPELGEFIFSDLMADICRASLGGNAFFHSDQFVIKCGKTGMSFSWHQDGAYVEARIGDHPECITCWCTLDDVDETNGTVYILPVSRLGKRELVEHRRDPETNDRIGYFGDDPGDPVIAPAGSVAVFSSLVFIGAEQILPELKGAFTSLNTLQNQSGTSRASGPNISPNRFWRIKKPYSDNFCLIFHLYNYEI